MKTKAPYLLLVCMCIASIGSVFAAEVEIEDSARQGLIGRWAFDDLTDGVLKNSARVGLDATVRGDVSLEDGVFAEAASLKGRPTIRIKADEAFRNLSSITISAWRLVHAKLAARFSRECADFSEATNSRPFEYLAAADNSWNSSQAEHLIGLGTFWRPDLSFDAKRVVFSFHPANEKNFHLYEINIDGSGQAQGQSKLSSHSNDGCHEMHSVTPDTKTNAEALHRAPSEIVPPPWGDESISYMRFVRHYDLRTSESMDR